MVKVKVAAVCEVLATFDLLHASTIVAVLSVNFILCCALFYLLMLC